MSFISSDYKYKTIHHYTINNILQFLKPPSVIAGYIQKKKKISLSNMKWPVTIKLHAQPVIKFYEKFVAADKKKIKLKSYCWGG